VRVEAEKVQGFVVEVYDLKIRDISLLKMIFQQFSSLFANFEFLVQECSGKRTAW